MNLVLIGYRGTGKSTVGRLVAERLGMRYVCMDQEIEQKAGRSITEIVAASGWDSFRDLESELARELSAQDNLVIDTGGGAIVRPQNVLVLRTNSRLFWLKASVETITSRIQGDGSRPALTSGKTFVEEVAEVLAAREPLYRTAAHYEINTDGEAPGAIAGRILALWAEGAV